MKKYDFYFKWNLNYEAYILSETICYFISHVMHYEYIYAHMYASYLFL